MHNFVYANRHGLMAKYDKKAKEAESSTESLTEISAGDFKGGAEESNSDSSSESLKEIAAGDFNGSHSDSSSASYSDSSSESLKEISAQEFVDGSRSSSRSKDRVNDCQNLNLFACAELIRNQPIEIDITEDEVQKEEIAMLIEANGSDSEKEEDETEVSLEDDKSDRIVENDLEMEENSKEIDDFDKKVGIIFEELESILEGVETSFEKACSKLQRCYMSLSQMLSEGHSPLLDKLAKQAFTGIQTLYSAYSSRSLKHMNLNKELLSRVLLNVKNQSYICLTEEQVKEIDARIHSLSSDEAVGKSKKDPKISSFIGLKSGGELGTPTNSRTTKVDLNPLLNLHEDYDEDSLPSPTYNNAPPLPALKPVEYESQPAPIPAQTMSTVPKNVNEDEYEIHPYVIDAFKAVSSYQQKHVKDPSVDVSQLLSPTPSDDGTDDKDDTCVEVSSSLVVTSAKIARPVSSSVHTNCDLGISQMTPTMPTEDTDVCHNSKVKYLGRSKDCRPEFMDPDIPQNGNTKEHKTVDDLVWKEHNVKRQRSSILQNGNTRKHKAVDDIVLKNHNVKRRRSSIPQNGSTWNHRAVNDHVLKERTLKRQRNGSVKSKDDQAPLGGNKWIENNCILSHINKINQLHDNVNGLNVGSTSSVLSSPVCVPPSPSGVKDSEDNPTISAQLVKEQPSLEAMDHENAAVQVVNGSFNTLATTQHTGKKLITNPQIHVQTSCMNDTEKSRMILRDPRRIVLDVVKKCGNPVSQPVKPTVSQPPKPRNKMGDSVTPLLREEVQSVSLPFQSTATHNSLSQYKKGSDNIFDKVLSSSTSTVTQNPELATGMEDLLSGYDKQRKADIKNERARRIAEQNKMFAARKLCLVLDLDHTLLNSAMFGEIDPLHEELLRKREAHDKTQKERHLYRLPHMGMWTKLRPGVRNFLRKASKLYELHVYTMGNKIYANEMTKILDPHGTLFSGRVISGGDDENTGAEDRVTKIKDLGGVLGMESSVVIIDDTVRVWPHHKLNLIAVERYMYFPSSRRQFGLNGPSLLELNRDEMPEYGTLASSLAVIERVHQNFFSHRSLDEVDVRTILAIEQRKILAGCKILFSRVFPLAEANPHLHPLWKTAEQFGAECTNEIDEHVTHVVAISKGTNKVNWALATGRFVVHPGWVEASALLYRRAKEQDFAVKR